MDTKGFFDSLGHRSETDTRVVATLRRALGEEPGAYPPAFPFVEPFTGSQGERARRLVYLAAGLWALAQRRESGAPVPLVDAVRRCAHGRDSSSIEKRFVALLESDGDELAWRLRHVVQLVASDGIAIDWPGLLKDLLAWDAPSRAVQSRWARAYWRRDEPEAAEGAAAPTPAS